MCYSNLGHDEGMTRVSLVLITGVINVQLAWLRLYYVKMSFLLTFLLTFNLIPIFYTSTVQIE